MTKQNIQKFLSEPKNRSKVYWSIFGVLLIFFFIINNQIDESAPGPYPPDLSQKIYKEINLPEFNLETIDGTKISSNNLQGKILVIDFWATWCTPCRKAIPDLIELKNEFGNKDFEILGISIDEFTRNTKSEVKPFVESLNVNYTIAYGTVDLIKKFDNLTSIPTTFIVSKKGKIVKKFLGTVPLSLLKSEILKLLK